MVLINVAQLTSSEIMAQWNNLHGSAILVVPRPGDELIIIHHGFPHNLGEIDSVAKEDGSGRNWLVRTNRFPVEANRKKLFVRLAGGINIPSSLRR